MNAVTRFVYDEVETQDEDYVLEPGVGEAWEREIYLSDQIELFKQHLISHISWDMMERALKHVLKVKGEKIAFRNGLQL